MAYIDFSQSTPNPAIAPMPIADVMVGALGRREWDIVRLARSDGLGSLREPNWIERTAARLFGREANRRLADPRLEALRRVAVLGWRYGYALPVSAIKDFKAAGFSMDQLEALLVRITSLRAAPPRTAV